MVDPVQGNARRDPRFAVKLKARTVVDGYEQAAVLRDISVSGAALEANDLYTNNTFVELHAEGFEAQQGRVVREFSGGYALEFEHTGAERKAMQEALKNYESVINRDKPLNA